MRVIRFFFVEVVEFVLVCLMIVLCTVLFVGVYSRYVMGQAVPWSDEVARYLFIWLVFLGAAVAVRRRAHYAVHLIVDRFAKRAKFATELFYWVIIMGFSVFITIQGLKVMEGVSVQISPALELNLSWVFLAIPVHGVLSFLYAGAHFWQGIRAEMKGGES
jgi:TRAP-type C4-dicarboxylate transport system permease small subunit